MPLLPLLLTTALAADPGTADFGKKGATISDASGDNTLNLGLSFQPRATVTLNGDPDATDADRVSEAGVRIRRMLLTANGTVAGKVDYRFRIDAAKALTFNDADGKSQTAGKPSVDDAQLVYHAADAVQVALGQWKVPYTASQVGSDTQMLFPDRPLPIDGIKVGDTKLTGFSWSREAGGAVLGQALDQRLEYAAGVFNGDGTNLWPGDDAPLWVARVATTPLGAYRYDEVDLTRDGLRLGVGVNAALERTPAYDDAGAQDGAASDLRTGADLRLAVRGLSFQAEGLYGVLTPVEGDPTRSLGAYAQVGYLLPIGLAPGVRWSRLDPSLNVEDDGVSTVDSVLNIYLPDPSKKGNTLGHRAQLQLAWSTALQDGLDHPLAHTAQVATSLTF